MTTARHTMHGPTAREQQMIDLDDAGHSVAEIARMMNITAKVVSGRLQNLSIHDSRTDRQFFQNGREGTANLATALLLAGGHR